jgi:Tol biopolymer transport system component
MGEVYRARDTRLQRDVALKVLPSAFLQDSDRLSRFRREARVLASLNHPHIGGIYGFEDDDLPALVLELVEGETLADRLGSGPIPLREALDIAGQIADALDAAHGAGIIHRDLKPSNVKITPDGVIKVLDFGLARTASDDFSSGDLSKSPTVTAGATEAGVILGTATYMSPEQARGKTADKRTDIWAFGCVLFEMLTGRRTFRGDTASDTIAAILQREPDWAALPANTPAGVRRLLQRCLEKDARRRLRDIGDVRHWLEDLHSPADRSTLVIGRGLVWTVTAIAVAALGWGWWWWATRTSGRPSAEVELHRLTDFVGMEESPAISPDGKTVAFVARTRGKRQIWVQLRAGGAPLQITNDEVDHEQPRWAPDSSSLVYFVPSPTPGEHGTLWEVPALGGEPRRLAVALGGGDISHDGRRLAFFRFDGTQIALVVIARDGSTPEQVRPLELDSNYEYPRWSPDDRWIAFQRDSLITIFDERVFIIPSSGDGDAQEVARGANLSGLAWLPGGSTILYSSSAGSTVLYPPLSNLRVVGRNGTGDRQVTFGDVSYVEPDVHASGDVTVSRIRMQSDVWKFPVDATPADNTRRGVRITRQTGLVQTPSVSPDESEVVYLSDRGGHGNLWIARAEGTNSRQITFERDPDVSVGVPVWSPTGNEIVFIVSRPGSTGLSVVNRDGSGLRQLVPLGISASWSGDGKWVYYSRSTERGICIEKVAIDGGAPVSVRCENANASAAAPDGTALYFVNLLIKRNGIIDHEIARARPETGRAEVLGRVTGSRVPVNRRYHVPVLSPDGLWLTAPLTDGTTSNIWVQPTDGAPMKPLTDFGERSILIARRVSWSADSRHVYAAVAETDADIVLLTGLR